ncbi:MAG: GNAT family N-acetyltransferase [Clostridiales bacterium]|nr:GNAT family N-acetyltransferase [Clostridiales bacterium]
MLKRVVFILEKDNWQSEISALCEEIAANKADVAAYNVQDILNVEIEINNSLYITDNAASQKYLQAKGAPVIVYLHKSNRDEQFLRAEYAIEQISEVEYKSLELAYLRLTGQPWNILTTDRCIVRETTIEDADSFYDIYKEPSITYYMEGLFEDKAAEIAYIKDYIKNIYGFYGYGMWSVLEKGSGQVIGRAGISWREGFDIPELGFVIAVPYQHQGYAYEVCHAILDYAVKELGFTSIQALVMKENKSSKALCKRLGFKNDGKTILDGIEYERLLFTVVG